ncbi:2-keto-4-pentenoate hydratase [Amycolatopsis acidiphila]|uniref:2-keto-4-pentenoate hydratase n=1 Tax=Amycolatopsis acidiphila TaxID=715473 RepID=A0A558ABV9_9PSEU|nr:2-keto-4-pentenoate hydratase [Amycolatopsis acidiphila]TVT21727.1 2-keto-4-pentenoate hydratase [Amycolatopsis acidiphila]UIJ64113.1 2-keto-4-pentenoate hydratase [Amycolatopsis acidiphila]GHG98424.1 2-keto-4-pentenoate hydratase [Amycolatopsis acidiphila]
MSTQARSEAVRALLGAYQSGVPVDPLTDQYDGLDVDDAYAIQVSQVQRWQADGAVVKGHKVGLSSAAMQRQLGVDQPDFGHLTDRMFHLESQPIDPSAFVAPKVEPEIAFVLGKPLAGPGVTVAEAVAAVEFVTPALEIIDSRIRDWKIKLVDTIADNASSAGVVLGSTATPLSQVNVRLVGGVLYHNGELVGTGAGGAVLGSPLNALVWLTNTLGARGVTLQAGHVVLPGSITAAVPVAAGDVATATFAGLGSVTARFSKEGGVK